MVKKAEGLSLTTIVIAALALLVLIILSVIFVGRIGKWSEKSSDCVQRGAMCYDVVDGATCREQGASLIMHPDAVCLKSANGNMVADDEKICCISAGAPID